MNENYIKASIVIRETAELLKGLLVAPANTFEEKQSTETIENLLRTMEDSVQQIQYFSTPERIGILRETENKSFELYGKVLSPGGKLEVFLEKHNCWDIGLIEFVDGCYTFNGKVDQNVKLYTGMKVRIRVP